MNEEIVEIGTLRLNISDVKKYWVDKKSEDERRSRVYHQENNYLASAFSLLVAGFVNCLMRRSRKSPSKNYLHIKTSQSDYCFSEDEIDIKYVVGKLN